jgi:hypothetical protein
VLEIGRFLTVALVDLNVNGQKGLPVPYDPYILRPPLRPGIVGVPILSKSKTQLALEKVMVPDPPRINDIALASEPPAVVPCKIV